MKLMTDGLPVFYIFREMCAHLLTGGAAYRYGSSYPIYVGRSERGMGGLERRTWNSGECVEHGYPLGLVFTVEEQLSVNWVLIPADEWKERDERMMQWHRDHDAKKHTGG